MTKQVPGRMTKEEFEAAYPGMSYPFTGVESPEEWEKGWENLKKDPQWQEFKKHAKERPSKQEDGGFWAGELQHAIGRKAEIYSARAPRVIGIVRGVDERWAKVIIKTDHQTVSISLGSISQVRLDD